MSNILFVVFLKIYLFTHKTTGPSDLGVSEFERNSCKDVMLFLDTGHLDQYLIRS